MEGKPLEAPKIAYILPEVRKLMLEGEYKKALDLSLAAAEKGETVLHGMLARRLDPHIECGMGSKIVCPGFCICERLILKVGKWRLSGPTSRASGNGVRLSRVRTTWSFSY